MNFIITDKRIGLAKPFSEIAVGELFEFTTVLYIRTCGATTISGPTNTVRLRDGMHILFTDTYKVVPIQAELILR